MPITIYCHCCVWSIPNPVLHISSSYLHNNSRFRSDQYDCCLNNTYTSPATRALIPYWKFCVGSFRFETCQHSWFKIIPKCSPLNLQYHIVIVTDSCFKYVLLNLSYSCILELSKSNRFVWSKTSIYPTTYYSMQRQNQF